MALHDPVTFSRIVRGMINIQQHEGMFVSRNNIPRLMCLSKGGSLNAVGLQHSNLFKAAVVSSSGSNPDQTVADRVDRWRPHSRRVLCEVLDVELPTRLHLTLAIVTDFMNMRRRSTCPLVICITLCSPTPRYSRLIGTCKVDRQMLGRPLVGFDPFSLTSGGY